MDQRTKFGPFIVLLGRKWKSARKSVWARRMQYRRERKLKKINEKHGKVVDF